MFFFIGHERSTFKKLLFYFYINNKVPVANFTMVGSIDLSFEDKSIIFEINLWES
jgi:hypothetical protein